MPLRRTAVLLVAILCCAAARASCIHGYVKSAADHPIRGATITLLETESDAARLQRREQVHPRPVFRRGQSDPRGWFRVDPRRRGDYDVLVTAPGYAPRLLHAAAGKNIGTVKLTPAPETRLALTCGHAPLVGAPVVVIAKDGAELFLNTDPAGVLRMPAPAVWVEELVVATSTGAERLHAPRAAAIELAGCGESARR
jgi:hypothetical protein